MFKDLDFWEKAIFESIKEELRSDFFSSDYDSNWENTTREILYSKLLSLQTFMLSFRIEKPKVKSLIIKYCNSYKLTQDQTIMLIQKMANFGHEQVVLMDQEN